jgi:hypothetical protein
VPPVQRVTCALPIFPKNVWWNEKLFVPLPHRVAARSYSSRVTLAFTPAEYGNSNDLKQKTETNKTK